MTHRTAAHDEETNHGEDGEHEPADLGRHGASVGEGVDLRLGISVLCASTGPIGQCVTLRIRESEVR